MIALKKQLIWFVGITFPLTWAVGIYIWDKGGLGNPLNMFAMYVPALTVLGLYFFIFKKPIFKKGDLGLNFKGLKYWLIVPLIITGISLMSYAISFLFHPQMFETAENVRVGLEDKGFYWGSSIIGFFGIVLVNGLVGSLLNIPMFLGEEIGWRAFMVPRLLKLYSPKFAFLIGAFLWALWHAVMIALGLNYPEVNPLLGVLIMTVFCIPVGIVFQYYYFKSKSIIVAALAHAALNKSAMSMSFLIADDGYNKLLYGPTGIIGILLFSIFAFYLYQKIDWEKENTLNK